MNAKLRTYLRMFSDGHTTVADTSHRLGQRLACYFV